MPRCAGTELGHHLHILASSGVLMAKLRTEHESTAADFMPVDIVEVVSSAVAIAKSTFRRHSNARLVDVRLPTHLPVGCRPTR